MVSIKTKYIILFWIIILILFTFYCIFRLKYLKEKYDNTQVIKNIPDSNYPIINYINRIVKQDKITDLTEYPECKNIYDDNIKVQSMGYSNCQSAYSDYITKKFDPNNKYGQTKSLADLCPISAKSKMYTQCMTLLLDKYTNNANMVDSISNDMTKSINKRLQDRSNVLDNVQNNLNPLIFNKDQNDFNNYMQKEKSVAKYNADVLGLVNTYYKDRYQDGLGLNNDTEGFVASTPVYIIDPAIEKLFFGNFKPINGQFLALDDLIISLGYDVTNTSNSVNTNPALPSQTLPNPSQGQTSKLNQINNIILTLNSISNNLYIIYYIVSIDNYKNIPNAVRMIISKNNVISDSESSNSKTLMKLLSTLGIKTPTQLIITYEEFTSTEKKLHKTYKLVNDNLDTILVLNKI